ncbi:hypothetical protein DXG03_007309, partial [Asterophora parasitica]
MCGSSVSNPASPVVSSFAPTAADVKADVLSISGKLKILNAAISALPLSSGSLLNVLTIHADIGSLITASNKAAADVV